LLDATGRLTARRPASPLVFQEVVMSEQNKTLTPRFHEEVLTNKKLQVIDELCAPERAGNPSGHVPRRATHQ